MSLMKPFLAYLFVAGLLLSCDTSEERTPSDQDGEKEIAEIETQVTNFSESDFPDEKSLEILKELDICSLDDSLGVIANCSPKNFKLIPFKKDVPMEDAFILQIKAGVMLKGSMEPLPPVRHIIVFERVNGELVKVNGFRGDIVATTKGKEAADLILALYVKADETLFHCRYTWNGSKYEFEAVESLDYGEGVRTLSENTSDSVTNDIYSAIMQSNLIF